MISSDHVLFYGEVFRDNGEPDQFILGDGAKMLVLFSELRKRRSDEQAPWVGAVVTVRPSGEFDINYKYEDRSSQEVSE